MTYTEALAAFDTLYAQLPQVQCKRLCHESCGVICMTKLEWLRIVRKLGYKPRGKPSLVCPMLKHGACSVHAVRPTICRLWGAVREARGLMQCPHGCMPDRWLSEEEGYAWLEKAEELSQAVFPHGEATAQAHGVRRDQIERYIQRARQSGEVR